MSTQAFYTFLDSVKLPNIILIPSIDHSMSTLVRKARSDDSSPDLPSWALLPPQRAPRTVAIRARRTFKPSTSLPETVSDIVGYPRINQYKFTPLESPDHIRLLVLHPAKYEEDRIECQLITTSLACDAPRYIYEALSYTWGTESPRHKIYIRADSPSPSSYSLRDEARHIIHKIYYIRTNLFEALKVFRRLDQPLVMWIDALYIDQDSQKEKTRQVLKMADIYNRAKNVCIWLGNGNDQTHLGMEFIPRVLDLDQFDRLVNDVSAAEEWYALAKLMTRQWFTRRWVVQELALARQATLHCGRGCVNWSDFADAVALLVLKLDIVKALLAKAGHLHQKSYDIGDIKGLGANVLVNATSNLFRKADDGTILERLSGIETLVSSLLTFEATDPKDTIYALLAIAQDTSMMSDMEDTSEPVELPDLNSKPGAGSPALSFRSTDEIPRFKADYRKPYVEVCKDYTEFCIQSSGSLDVICRHWAPIPKRIETTTVQALRIERNQSPACHEELPSWIPLLKEATFGNPQDALNGRVNGDSLVSRPGRRTYNASRGKRADAHFGHALPSDLDEGRLCKSSLDDETRSNTNADTHCIAQGNTDQNLEAISHDGSGKAGYVARMVRHSELSMYVEGIRIDTVAELTPRMASGMIFKECLEMGGWAEDPADDDRESTVPDRLWRTMVANRGPDGINPPSWYQRASEHAIAARTRTGDIEVKTLIGPNKASVMVEFLKRVQSVVWNRKFLKSRTRELLGLASWRGEKNDMICILMGCSVPVLLRKRETGNNTYFELIGECYVHGIMDGQAMKWKLKKTWFELR